MYEQGKGAVKQTAEEAQHAAWEAVQRTEAAASAAKERANSSTGQVGLRNIYRDKLWLVVTG